jgi:hypothetical protein
MALPLPSRSSLFGGMAGVAAWAICTGLQSYGLMPVAASAAPAVINVLQAVGILPVGAYPPDADPVSFVVGLLTKMFVSRIVLRYWPSAAEADMMLKSLASIIPVVESENDQLDPSKSAFPINRRNGGQTE